MDWRNLPDWLFSEINRAAFLFGAAFIAQALLFAFHAVRAHTSRETFNARLVMGWIMIGYAAVLYPLLNAWLGHAVPAAPSFGVTPCPLTIFTFGVMTLARTRLPWRFYAIPTIWSVVGGAAAMLLDVTADWGMPVASLLAVACNARKARPT